MKILKDIYNNLGTGTKTSLTKQSTTYTGNQKNKNEKTTEGILKAARLGDLKMLTELHREGIDSYPGILGYHYNCEMTFTTLIYC